jgi:hypothetical protein
MYGAAKVHSDRFDRSLSLESCGFCNAVRSEIGLRRVHMLADRQQLLMLQLGSPLQGLSR